MTQVENINTDQPKLYLGIRDAVEQHKKRPKESFLFMGIKNGPGLYFIVAPAKSGKTILMENLAYALATDASDFMGYPIPNGKKILVVSLEEHEGGRLDRAQKQIDALVAIGIDIENLDNRMKVISENFPRYLIDDKTVKALKNVVLEFGPDVIIIDSLSRMYTGAIEDSSKAQSVVQGIRDMAEEFGVPLLIIHHTTKMSGKELTMDSMAGSRMLSQECDGIIGIGKTKSGNRYIKPLAYRYADDTVDEVDSFHIDENCLIVSTGKVKESKLLEETDKRVGSDNRDAIESFIKGNCSVSSDQLEVQFKQDMVRATLYYNLSVLVKNGVVNKPHKGQYTHSTCGNVISNKTDDIQEEESCLDKEETLEILINSSDKSNEQE